MRSVGDRATSVGGAPPEPEDSARLTPFNQYRALLFSIAYRMVGSVADAEDMLRNDTKCH